MADNLARIVNIIESSVNNSELNAENDVDANVLDTSAVTTTASTTPTTPSRRTSRKSQNEEIFFSEPTFSDRLLRYLVIVVYLCGLCSLGFILSIYHIFIWDSRMPPVYKAVPTKKPLYVKY